MQDIVTIIDELRAHTLETMKPEMASWAKEYTPKMEDVKTELTINKLNGSGINPKKGNYSELFRNRNRMPHTNETDRLVAELSRKGITNAYTGEMVFVSGDIGSGKSLMGKKVAYDWAKGIFTAFSVVFFVCMKLVRPGDVIEDIIAQQYCSKDLSLKRVTLQSIFDKLGDRCLLILDDSQEFSQSLNLNILEFLKQKKYCHFLVTSRFEPTDSMINDFSTVARVEWSLYESFEQIADMRMTLDRSIVPNVLSTVHQENQYNPMLCMFLCKLAAEKGFDFDIKTVCLGNIYAKLVRILYKSYQFGDYVGKQVGKLAFNTLRHVTKSCLDSVDCDNILILGRGQFPHRTLEVFCATLYFILVLNEGESIESLLGSDCTEPIFMINPLFLHFCLWFLCNDQMCFTFENKKNVYDKLQTYAVERIDFVQLDTVDIAKYYPALDWSLFMRLKDSEVLEFMQSMLSTCKNTKVLFLSPDLPVCQILSKMQPGFHNLRFIYVVSNMAVQADVLTKKFFDRTNKVISDQRHRCQIEVILESIAEDILEFFQKSERMFRMHVVGTHVNYRNVGKPMTNMSKVLKGNISGLHFQRNLGGNFLLYTNQDIEACVHLSHLTLASGVSKTLLLALSKAVKNGHLPSLSHLSFAGCGDVIKGKLCFLFNCTWLALTDLDLTECNLNVQDIKSICAKSDGEPAERLPNLTALALSPEHLEFGKDPALHKEYMELFIGAWNRLTSLKLLNSNYLKGENPCISAWHNALQGGNVSNLVRLDMLNITLENLEGLPNLHSLTVNCGGWYHLGTLDLERFAEQVQLTNLRHLDLSNSSLARTLQLLMYHSFPLLRSLVLSHCGLDDQAVHVLAQASTEGRFPKLRHMDLSMNKFGINSIFQFNSKWTLIESLAVDGDIFSWETVFQNLVAKLHSGYLHSLQMLHLSFVNPFYSENLCRRCNRPIDDYIARCRLNDKEILEPIVNNLQLLESSSIDTIYIHTPKYPLVPVKTSTNKQKIYSKNITVFFIHSDRM